MTKILGGGRIYFSKSRGCAISFVFSFFPVKIPEFFFYKTTKKRYCSISWERAIVPYPQLTCLTRCPPKKNTRPTELTVSSLEIWEVRMEFGWNNGVGNRDFLSQEYQKQFLNRRDSSYQTFYVTSDKIYQVLTQPQDISYT